jgi:hypothetical protein
MPVKISMTLNSGNAIYNYPAPRNGPVRQVRRAGIDLNNPMIGRIQFAPAGCGGCGGK